MQLDGVYLRGPVYGPKMIAATDPEALSGV
jgi:hypothetical protein